MKFDLFYEDLIQPKKTKLARKGGKDITKMSKSTTNETPSKKKYSKTRGEHIKDIVIAVLLASIVAFAIGMKFESSQSAKIQSAVTANAWSCSAEDEVVVIDGTCRHIDQLAVETPVKK